MSTPPYSPDSDPDAGSSAPTPRTTRLRYSQTASLVLILLIVGAIPFASGIGWWGLLLFVPIVFGWYLLRRVGADVSADEVVVRGPFYTRHVPRADIAGLAVDEEQRVALLRRDESTIVLPTARPRDLSRLRQILFPESGENAA